MPASLIRSIHIGVRSTSNFCCSHRRHSTSNCADPKGNSTDPNCRNGKGMGALYAHSRGNAYPYIHPSPYADSIKHNWAYYSTRGNRSIDSNPNWYARCNCSPNADARRRSLFVWRWWLQLWWLLVSVERAILFQLLQCFGRGWHSQPR